MSAPLLPVTDLRPAQRNERTGPWFDALADGVLTVQTCTACGHAARPDATTCPRCHCEALAWAPARGTGTVIAVITDHSPTRDGTDPLNLGLVELDEGPWLNVRILDEAAVGDAVSLVVLVPEQGEPVPAFRVS